METKTMVVALSLIVMFFGFMIVAAQKDANYTQHQYNDHDSLCRAYKADGSEVTRRLWRQNCRPIRLP